MVVVEIFLPVIKYPLKTEEISGGRRVEAEGDQKGAGATWAPREPSLTPLP